MKAASLAIGLVFVSLFALCLDPGASAASVTLSPGIPYSKTIHADTLDLVNYSWSVSPSTATVEFVILQPGGTQYWNYSGNSYDFFVIAGLSGDYTFRWTNPGSTSVTLTYDISSAGDERRTRSRYGLDSDGRRGDSCGRDHSADHIRRPQRRQEAGPATHDGPAPAICSS